MDDCIELDIKIEAKDLYDFLLSYTYGKSSGVIGTTMGALLIILGLGMSSIIYIIAGIVVILYQPGTLFLRSRRQALSPAFKAPLHYRLDDEGITVSQGDKEEHQAWEDMVKATSSGRSIFIYTSAVNATILPRSQLKDQKFEVIQMISTHMPPNKVKIRM